MYNGSPFNQKQYNYPDGTGTSPIPTPFTTLDTARFTVTMDSGESLVLSDSANIDVYASTN
jgi:hypothetical protein